MSDNIRGASQHDLAVRRKEEKQLRESRKPGTEITVAGGTPSTTLLAVGTTANNRDVLHGLINRLKDLGIPV